MGADEDLFSAYAEVFLFLSARPGDFIAFLCLRRGVSSCQDRKNPPKCFSLPTQRCFRYRKVMSGFGSLFSAYAEVFLTPSGWFSRLPPFLCLRRGVSIFPEIAGVMPTFLCLRRGVSVSLCSFSRSPFFSLPTQRCFRHWDDQ